MRGLCWAAPVAAALLVAGCARDRLVLLPGEGDHPVGAVAVLDPATGLERGQIDAGNRTTPLTRSKKALRVKGIAEKKVAKRYGGLIGGLPEPSRVFILIFQTDSTELTPESKALLADIFAELQRREGAEVQIIGHTDSMGDETYNDALSIDRAKVVQEWLIAQGLPRDLTRATGRGERDAKAETGDEIASAQWRRAEVVIR